MSKVLVALGREGGWASARTLADRLALGPHEVQGELDRLEREGYIERYDGGSSHGASVYRTPPKE